MGRARAPSRGPVAEGRAGRVAAMCGIVGYVGNKQVVPLIIDGLRKLEYRGYDSAGIAVVDENHRMSLRRAEGKLRNLEECIRLNPLDGNYGMPNFTTAQLYYYEYEMSVEAFDEPKDKLVDVHVVDQTEPVVISESGFFIRDLTTATPNE